jgi:hypothetical protein
MHSKAAGACMCLHDHHSNSNSLSAQQHVFVHLAQLHAGLGASTHTPTNVLEETQTNTHLE